MVDPKFAYAVEEFGIAQQARLQTNDALCNSRLGGPILEPFEPVAEINCLANLNYL